MNTSKGQQLERATKTLAHQTNGTFRKSSYSASGNCVEVATFPNGSIHVRDSKNKKGPVLAFNRDEWRAFLKGAQSGEFTI